MLSRWELTVDGAAPLPLTAQRAEPYSAMFLCRVAPPAGRGADRALAWIERYGDADGDGFVEYARKTEHGLVNQGWKDSFDGVNFADGRLAEPPIALAEVQGYTYAAYRARAQIARAAGDIAGAAHWDGKADDLKEAFNRAYWLPADGWFAVALDRAKEPVDALTSNIGHCLWTGIIDADKAPQVAAQLMSEEMFSGWGIRTLAAPLQILHSLLRLVPDLAAGRAWCAPAIPRRYLPVQVSNLRLGQSRLAMDIRADGWDITGLDGAGITLIQTPPPAWSP